MTRRSRLSVAASREAARARAHGTSARYGRANSSNCNSQVRRDATVAVDCHANSCETSRSAKFHRRHGGTFVLPHPSAAPARTTRLYRACDAACAFARENPTVRESLRRAAARSPREEQTSKRASETGRLNGAEVHRARASKHAIESDATTGIFTERSFTSNLNSARTGEWTCVYVCVTSARYRTARRHRYRRTRKFAHRYSTRDVTRGYAVACIVVSSTGSGIQVSRESSAAINQIQSAGSTVGRLIT